MNENEVDKGTGNGEYPFSNLKHVLITHLADLNLYKVQSLCYFEQSFASDIDSITLTLSCPLKRHMGV